LASALFTDRISSLEISSDVPAKNVKLKTRFCQDWKEYELLACKVDKDSSPWGFHRKSTGTIVYYYVMVKGNGAPVLNLRDELEKLCDYGSLGRQKVVARLGHLVSEAHFVHDVPWSDIEIIKDSGEEGCGYIPDGKSSSQ
jgi:hypothetical protein